jgi:hypothetical protein
MLEYYIACPLGVRRCHGDFMNMNCQTALTGAKDIFLRCKTGTVYKGLYDRSRLRGTFVRDLVKMASVAAK